MSSADLDVALKRLESAFEALRETRERLFSETERATTGALNHMEQLDLLFDPNVPPQNEPDPSSDDENAPPETLVA